VTLLSAQQAAAYYDPELSKGAYATRDAYLADLVDFTRREIAELARLGCEYIQIDAPQYAALLDETIREGYRQRGSDPDRLLDTCIELDNAIIDGHPGVTFGIHICRGNHEHVLPPAATTSCRASSGGPASSASARPTTSDRDVRAAAARRTIAWWSSAGQLEAASWRAPSARAADRRGVALRPAGAARDQPAVRLRVHARRQPPDADDQRGSWSRGRTARAVWAPASTR
jgi:5-methyltetrahydropteroyltriglutamate--homocysteine methyltransferase